MKQKIKEKKLQIKISFFVFFLFPIFALSLDPVSDKAHINVKINNELIPEIITEPEEEEIGGGRSVFVRKKIKETEKQILVKSLTEEEIEIFKNELQKINEILLPDFCPTYFPAKRGDVGKNVKNIQNFLKKKGFLSAEISGYFGPLTAQATKKYQSFYPEIYLNAKIEKPTELFYKYSVKKAHELCKEDEEKEGKEIYLKKEEKYQISQNNKNQKEQNFSQNKNTENQQNQNKKNIAGNREKKEYKNIYVRHKYNNVCFIDSCVIDISSEDYLAKNQQSKISNLDFKYNYFYDFTIFLSNYFLDFFARFKS